jgi:hypothetical protein
MSMDDPGWGEAVPDVPATPSAPRSSGGPGGGSPLQNRNVLIGVGAVVVIAIVVVVAVLASGGHHNKSATTTTVAPTTSRPSAATTTTTGASAALAKAGATYLSYETPAYNSLTAFGSAISDWDKHAPTAAVAQQTANPAVLAFKKLNQQLLSHTWPASVQAKMDTLASQAEVVSNDLGGLQLAFTQGTESQWGAQFTTDGNTLVTDADAVRTALGLPQLPS